MSSLNLEADLLGEGLTSGVGDDEEELGLDEEVGEDTLNLLALVTEGSITTVVVASSLQVVGLIAVVLVEGVSDEVSEGVTGVVIYNITLTLAYSYFLGYPIPSPNSSLCWSKN